MTRRHLIPLALIALVGCGPKPAPVETPVDVTGRLTAGGKPFGNVILTLHPQDAAVTGQRPTVLVKADGTFATRCLPGVYKVTLTPLPNAPGSGAPGDAAPVGPGAPPAGNIPPAYTATATTPWALTVQESGNGEFVHAVGK